MATMWNSINESGYVGATETFSSIFCQFVGIWDCMQKINTLFSVKRSKIFSGKMLSWIHTFTPKVHHEESETYASSPSKELRENNSAKQFCCIFLYCVGSSKHNKSSQSALNIVFPLLAWFQIIMSYFMTCFGQIAYLLLVNSWVFVE